jgi:hypothetical protein
MSEISEQYPLGGSLEPYDIEREKQMLFEIENGKNNNSIKICESRREYSERGHSQNDRRRAV